MNRSQSTFLLFCIASGVASAETHFVTLADNYTPQETVVIGGDHVIIQASIAHPLKFDMNPDVTCTNAQCGYLFANGDGPFHFHCANHPSESGSIAPLSNDDIIISNGFDVPLTPVDV